ncbi:type I pantothenate kinase [Tropheryma whipplei]|uniref:type I pantothenate kinase n=1 Tax=Tropheryma whipplei TaxID=2039 RepID=UPI000000C7B3|nr:type I pantothenate kinase [Tropheryma whipplei]MCO8183059.1 type I pantothenate kinase [Tropheryma whipplei]CAD66836.1 pantothenate kinase [Tropheryma whipplei TW08/27]
MGIEVFKKDITKTYTEMLKDIRKRVRERGKVGKSFIIGITGSVAAGKSTLASDLAKMLDGISVEVISTDGYLYPNKILEQKGLMLKKGFPESYDTAHLASLVKNIKAGAKTIGIRQYAHPIHDVTGVIKTVNKPEILIIEGLNVMRHPVKTVVDLGIYIEAPKRSVFKWYVKRFFELRAQHEKNTYFRKYANLPRRQCIKMLKQVWRDVNRKNFTENILPVKHTADFIVYKNPRHKMTLYRNEASSSGFPV